MNINNLKDFIELIENYVDKKEYNSNVIIPGIAYFKNYILEVSQYIDDDSKDLLELTPLKKRLFNSLVKLDKNTRNELVFSTITSYFTPNDLVDSVVKSTLEYLKDANKNELAILEPSAGDGIFITNLETNLKNYNFNTIIHSVEKDPFTFSLLENNTKKISNNTNYNLPFENYNPSQKYDLIIGNIPFGNYSIYDTELNKEDHKIINNKVHNYFFYKAKKLLQPGGIIVFITSKEITDSINENKIRENLLGELNLISSVRFPQETFQQAKTSVITDLLVFQKPILEKSSLNQNNREIDFLSTRKIAEENISKFYQSYPENLLGELYLGKGYLGKETILVKAKKTLPEVFKDSFSILKNDYSKYALNKLENYSFEKYLELEERKIISENKDLEIRSKYPDIAPGNVVIENNSFFKVCVNPEFNKLFLTSIEVNIKNRERLQSLVEIRDVYKLFRNNLREKNNDIARQYQIKLNELYDNFIFFYDNVNTSQNISALQLDSEKQLLLNLEIKEKDQWIKSDIFNENIFETNDKDLKITDITEAVYLSLNEYGHINEDYISKVYKKEKEDWIKEALENKILFLNPVFNEDINEIKSFELAPINKFNSGYIEAKLNVYNSIFNKHSEKLGEYRPYFNKKTESLAKDELIKNIPHRLSIQEIDPALGEPWIDNRIFELFGKEYFQDPNFKILYNSNADKYKVISFGSSIGNINYNISGNRKYISYADIFNYALMHNTPEFYKKEIINGKEIKIADIQLNTAVVMNVEKLQNAFSQWLFQKEELSKMLEDKYHFLNNANVKQKFEGSYLKFDEINGYEPYEHQKSCALELALNNGGLVDHKVGAGKTLTIAMATMLKKKFNISNKELVVGLPANYEQIYETFCSSYPNGNFMIVRTDDINTNEKAQDVFYKIANNKYDAIITSHSTLLLFPEAPYTNAEILKETIEELKITIQDSENDKQTYSPGDIKKLLKKLNDAEISQKRNLDIINSRKNTGSIIFDDLGIGGITIDESQYFKNLHFSTRHSRVAGLGSNDDVKKTKHLLSYVRYIQNINENKPGKYKGITKATGTTISNSISELFTLFKYMIPWELKKKGIKTFDQWARVYARKSQEYEESVTGNIKLKERFRYFVKVPELAKMYSDMTNYVDDSVFKLDAPELDYQMKLIDSYKEQKEFFEAIKKFGQNKDYTHILPYKNISQESKAVGLICTSLGRQGSLSLKLINKDLPDDENDKVHVMVEEILKFYQKFDQDKGTQLIFSDQGVPKSNKDFDIYNYVKSLLVKKGIPENEIAFIHNYKKKKKLLLYDQVNKGSVRIVLGSTETMGVGVNMQERIVALHHLDLPWRPSDLEQRNGRGGRPGNVILKKYDNKLAVLFYATKETLDSYNFNILQIKQNFISQIKNANISIRRIDEGAIDNKGNMNFNEYMAACSPNQYLTEKLKLEKEYQKVLDQKSSFQMLQRKNKTKHNLVITEISKISKIIENLEKDFNETINFNEKIFDDKTFKNDQEISLYLRYKLEESLKKKTPGIISKLDKGFSLVTSIKNSFENFSKENYSIFLKTPSGALFGYKSHNFTKKDEEVAAYSKNAMNRIFNTLTEQKNNNLKNIEYANKLKEALDVKFQKEEEILNLKNEIKKMEENIIKENKLLESNTPDIENKKLPGGKKL